MDLIEDATFLTPRNSPENTIGVGGTFNMQMGDGELEIYGKYAWVDDVETNLLNTPLGRVDAREDLTASVGYHAEQYSIVVFGRNLTDERTETFVPIATLFGQGNVNRPRTFGVEISYEL